MAKRLIYVAFWQDELKELVAKLKEIGYSESQIEHFEMLLNSNG